MSELSAQRHAELEEEFYEEWHPGQGTNMLDMLVHKVIKLEESNAFKERFIVDMDNVLNKGMEPSGEFTQVNHVATLKRDNEALYILRDRVDWFTKPHRESFDGTNIRCELCEAWEKYEDALLADTQE